ncbi:Fic family protein [Flavobacterium orientale]|uniref:Cell division protein Fic n=1 Tax=Flavobacterium orientale TaxID=1756020 RepID=A0A916XWP7_9FLAO|nr:Fic family protein [Flavobacterium orientale]GGD18084.1 cell division protein Fic [Flavobacterium orientale]
MNSNHFSLKISVFHGRQAPEEGTLVGYGALIEKYRLQVPLPNRLALISTKKRHYSTNQWLVLTSRHEPEDTLYKQLVFALKYEGVNMLFFKKLFEKLSENNIKELVQIEPNGQYSRKMWFLYEWLMGTKLAIPDLTTGNFVYLIDENLQYASPISINSGRHRVKNNLAGTVDFCPLLFKTEKLEHYIAKNNVANIAMLVNGFRKDILLRTSAFLLLKDSKASFGIEGETPTQNRAVRWGKAIGQAGTKPLSNEELYRLQQIVIENSRFITMGYRTEGGFVGEHDRITGEPIPEHISASPKDVTQLMNGLLKTSNQLESVGFHPVLTAAIIAFGFVFIHPLVDGNGRIHRYLIHHLLAAMKYSPQGIIFPISATILERIDDYRRVLESYSLPLLDHIEWEKTTSNNVNVLNETIDYYKYFDATPQAEFLFECVDTTIHKTLPEEVAYLQKYDEMKLWLDNLFQMPDSMVALLIRFLEQNNGVLSKRALEKEFSALTLDEITTIQEHFKRVFVS